MSFDPYKADVNVSLNRVRVVDLPGIDVPEHMKGKRGSELIGTSPLLELIRAHADELGLADEMDSTQLLRRYYDCLEDTKQRVVAERIAHTLGENLGYMLLTLKRGDTVNREARAEWDDSYWAFWAQVRYVWFGGGRVSGEVGRWIVQTAQQLLSAHGFGDVQLSVAEYPSVLPLVGASRHIPANYNGALVFDFGQSYVKRAYARYEGDTLTLHQLPSVPAHAFLNMNGFYPPDEVAAHLLQTIKITWDETRHFSPSPFIVVSLACYLSDGHPIQQRGTYDQLSSLAPNLQLYLSEQLSAALGEAVRVKLLHDATAAAMTYAPESHAAVIMIGTALGVGFPVSDGNIRPLNTVYVKTQE